MVEENRGASGVSFVVAVCRHIAGFHIPFMKLLQGWGYEVHAAAATEAGRRSELEAAGDIPFAHAATGLRDLRAREEGAA